MKYKTSFFVVFFFFTQLIFAQSDKSTRIFNQTSRASDSLELINFYRQTRGELWKENWDFSEPLEDWYGVRLNNIGRVFCIDLDGYEGCNSTKNGGNHLHGTFPELNLPFLEHLFLSSNKISGNLPSLEKLPNLLTLQLSGNRFTGKIPYFDGAKKIAKIDLEYNTLYGEIPDFELLNLESLYLSNNLLSGELPSLQSCTKLKHLYVNNNQLGGELPDFKDLNNLSQLIISNNSFRNELPDYYKLNNLEILIANNNELSGCYIKSEYSDFKRFSVDNNYLHNCQSSDYKIPNAISPNGDGINDHLDLRAIPNFPFGEGEIEFIVWNSNKIPVYSSTHFEGIWKGCDSEGATNLQEGLYMYSLKSGTNVATGTVYIKR